MKVLNIFILLLLFHYSTGSNTFIDAGNHYTCAKMYDGAINCWGKNNLGQLGNGNIEWLVDLGNTCV